MPSRARGALLPRSPKAVLACVRTVRDELGGGRRGYGAEVDAALETRQKLRRRPPPIITTFPAASSRCSRCRSCCSGKPDLLLLDEPTKGSTMLRRAWVVHAVGAARDAGATVLLAT